MQNQLASMFRSTAFYLCKDGVCDNPAEVFRAWTGEAADAVRPLVRRAATYCPTWHTWHSSNSPGLTLLQ